MSAEKILIISGVQSADTNIISTTGKKHEYIRCYVEVYLLGPISG